MRILVLAALSVLLMSSPPETPRRSDSLLRVRIMELYQAGDREGVLEASRDLVRYHQEQGNEKEMFLTPEVCLVGSRRRAVSTRP